MMRIALLKLLFTLALGGILSSSLIAERFLERSDVVLPNIEYDYRESGSMDAFQADGTIWGFLPSTNGNFDTSNWEDVVAKHHEDGLKIQARIEWDVVWDGMLQIFPDTYDEAFCLDFDGNPIAYPWNGQEFWFCSRQPKFIEYHKFQIREIALAAAPDSLLFDSQTATPLTYGHKGCFCDRCMEDFSGWMDTRFSEEELVDRGIENVETWNYQTYLKELGWDYSSYSAQVWKRVDRNTIPLAYEYRLFQLQYLNEYMAELAAYAKEKAGYDISISTSAPILANEGMRLVYDDAIDLYVQEFDHRILDQGLSEGVVAFYKMADALGKRLALTGIPNADWYQLENPSDGVERVNLVWLWVAQAYANGANFIVPRRMWGYNLQGSHTFYRPETSKYEDIFKFISRNEHLFDGFQAVAPVGLLYSHTAFRHRSEAFRTVARELLQANVPYRLIVAGDEWWPEYFEEEELSALEVLVKPSDAATYVDAAQTQVMESIQDKTIVWDENGLDSLFAERASFIDVSEDDVSIFPRQKGLGPLKEGVIHLVNRNYDFTSDGVSVLSDVTLTVDKRLFMSELVEATYYRPATNEGTPLTIVEEGESYKLTVPHLEHWGIVSLKIGNDEDSDGLWDTWEREHFDAIDHVNAHKLADPDGDGQANWLEFYFETDPRDPSSRYGYRARWLGSSFYANGKRAPLGDLVQQLEVSTDLVNWETVPNEESLEAMPLWKGNKQVFVRLRIEEQ